MASGTVVVVEDRLVSNLVGTVLRKRGYEVKSVGALEAAELLRSSGSDVGVLITNTPGAFLEFSGRVPLLYLSSMPDPLLQAAFRCCRVVIKPFAPQDLVGAVTDLMTPP